MNNVQQHLNILGTRGIPAAHGGFETFAEHLAIYLQNKGWKVNVYCQLETDELGNMASDFEDEWQGIHRTHIGTTRSGAIGTMEFDLKCAIDVLNRPGKDLVLGYNTAVFNTIQRLWGRRVFMNMDGIEWKRNKWSLPAKIWFFVNEVIGANICSVPIADHPEIAKHVAARTFKRPIMIPYGADNIEGVDVSHIRGLGLMPDEYFVSIARIEPENSIHEIINAFSQTNSDRKCVILGKLEQANAYHREVQETAGENVIFAGAIYDQKVVKALRFYARAYFHGHQVGGTNPSLVEALGAGNAIIAHDNKFNRWTTGGKQFYFSNVDDCKNIIETIGTNENALVAAREAATEHHQSNFTWEKILSEYQSLLLT